MIISYSHARNFRTLYLGIVCLFSGLAYSSAITAHNSKSNNSNDSFIEVRLTPKTRNIIPDPNPETPEQQETDTKSEKKSSKWQKFRTVWRHWYNARQLLYSCDYGAQLLTGGDMALDHARSKLLGTKPGNASFLTIRLGTGILDASLAGKPTEEIVRDDVIHQATYLGCLYAYNKTIERIKQYVLKAPGAPAIAALVPTIANYIISPFLPPNYSLDWPYKVAGFTCKQKLIETASNIIAKPTGYIAYKSIQQYKKYKARKNNNKQVTPASTTPTDAGASQKTQNQPAPAQKVASAQEQQLSNNTTLPIAAL